MSLSTESNTSLAFDTATFRECGNRYAEIAGDLRDMAGKLDGCLAELASSGWTTPAGSAFQKMTETNWRENIEKYAGMLDMLKTILDDAANQYDGLVTNHIERTRL